MTDNQIIDNNKNDNINHSIFEGIFKIGYLAKLIYKFVALQYYIQS